MMLVVKKLPTNAGDVTDSGSITGIDSLEDGMAAHSSVLAWRIPWTAQWAMVHRVAKSWI